VRIHILYVSIKYKTSRIQFFDIFIILFYTYIIIKDIHIYIYIYIKSHDFFLLKNEDKLGVS